MQDEEIVAEFTHQAETFNTSIAARDVPTLEEIMRLAAPQADERWLEVACGPGILSRELATRASAVHGVDMTPAMIEVARREAAAAGLGNATFAVGDATALDLPTASVDGAIARFAIHHIPAPIRMVHELARVVRPGGRIILADHVADTAPDAAAWSQEIERLRDPSHWASLPVARLRKLGAPAGLSLESETFVPLVLDFEDWLQRGSGGASARDVIEGQLDHRPGGVECFQISERDGRRSLELRIWVSRWVRA
jgi:SAM-dependent methyltransferase